MIVWDQIQLVQKKNGNHILQNLHNIEQPYNTNIYIISQSILNEIVNGDPSRLLEMQGTSLGDNWYPNLVQPGDYFYYTCTINPHMNQTGVTDQRTYLIKAKVIYLFNP